MPPTTGNPAIDALLVYGVLGIIVALFVLGWIVAKPTVVREQTISDRLLVNNEKLADGIDRLTDAVLRDRAGGG